MEDGISAKQANIVRLLRDYLGKMSELRITPSEQLAQKIDELAKFAHRSAKPLEAIAQMNEVNILLEALRVSLAAISQTVRDAASRTQISETTRSSFDAMQHEIISHCDDLAEMHSSAIDVLLRDGDIEVRDVIALLETDKITKGGTIRRVYLRILRRFYPFMNEKERAKVQSFLEAHIDKLLDCARVPYDSKMEFWAQSLTQCSLIPLTMSLPLEEIFAIFGVAFLSDLTLRENLANLAREVKVGVIFLKKHVGRNKLEFQWRPLFDGEYIRAKALTDPRFAGLSDRSIARYETIVPIHANASESEDEDAMLRIDINADASRLIILESFLPGIARVLAYRNSKGSLIVNARRVPIFRLGATTRADEYNRRVEDILVEARAKQEKVGHIREAINIFTSGDVDPQAFANTLLNQIKLAMRAYFLDADKLPSLDNFDLQRFCWSSIAAALKYTYEHLYHRNPSPIERISVQRIQEILFVQLVGKKDRLALSLDIRREIIDEIEDKLRGEECLIVTETLTTIFMRVKGVSK